MKLDGKIAVITGGSSGIGLATAKTFLAEGARVYVTGRRKRELDAAVAPLGPNAVAVQGDVSKPADLDRLYDLIRQEVGHVDVVFANAGIGGLAPLGNLTETHVDALLGTVTAVIALGAGNTRAVAAPSVINAIGVENEYADVISQIGGQYVQVSAIETDPEHRSAYLRSKPKGREPDCCLRLIVENGIGFAS
jgi:NAD(P)-dependent dehydrogenase (short-subunit alcohol dehydrogenase family)